MSGWPVIISNTKIRGVGLWREAIAEPRLMCMASSVLLPLAASDVEALLMHSGRWHFLDANRGCQYIAYGVDCLGWPGPEGAESIF